MRWASELKIPVYTWAITRWHRAEALSAPASRETREPAALLAHLRSLRAHGIYVLKDFARHLSEPEVRRAFRDAAQELAQAKASMWIVGAGHDLAGRRRGARRPLRPRAARPGRSCARS